MQTEPAPRVATLELESAVSVTNPSSSLRGGFVLQPKLPVDDYSLVIRTDFSDDAVWRSVCDAIQAPQVDGFEAMVELISDKACIGLAPSAVCSMVPGTPDERLFVFIFDSQTVSGAENPLLVVDTEDPDRQFRVVPSAAWAVENNLRLSNMGFDEFEAWLGPDGVFRGIDGIGA